MSSDHSQQGYAQAPNGHHQNHATTSRHGSKSKSKSRSRSTSQSRHYYDHKDDHSRHTDQKRERSDLDLRQSISRNVDVDEKSCSVCDTKQDHICNFHNIKVCKGCLNFYFSLRHNRYGIPKHCKFTENESCNVHYLSLEKPCSYCRLMKLYSVGFHTIKQKNQFSNKSPKNVFKRLGDGVRSPPFKQSSAQRQRENSYLEQLEQSVGRRIDFGGNESKEKQISGKTKHPSKTNRDDAVNSTTGSRVGSENMTRSRPKNSATDDCNANMKAIENHKPINNNVTTTVSKPEPEQQRRPSASEVPTTSRAPTGPTCRICGTQQELENLHWYKGGSQPVMSCESCRQFIRESKSHGHDYLAAGCCYGTGKCFINDENRSECKCCWLQKCLRLHLLKLPEKKASQQVDTQPPKPKEPPSGPVSSEPVSEPSAEKPPVQNKPSLSTSPIPIGKQQPATTNTTDPATSSPQSLFIDDYCRVCGSRDRVCKSYDAIMCHACISFYCGRNTGHSKVPNKCVTGLQNCEITPETRTICRFCRMQKCYQAGCPPLVEQENFASTSKTPSPKKSLEKQTNKASPVTIESPPPGSEKVCSVCKDTRAVDKCYGCVMCGACRQFYYQIKVGNNRKPKRQNCTGGQGNCVINVETRKDCRYCRLQQMLLMGCQKLVKPTRREKPAGSSGLIPFYPKLNKFKSSSSKIKSKVVPVFNPRVRNQFTKHMATSAPKQIKKCELCADDEQVSPVPSSNVDILLCFDCQNFNQKVPHIKEQLKIVKCVVKEFNCEINAQTRGHCSYCRMRKLARVIKAKMKARRARKQLMKSSSLAQADHQTPTTSSTKTLVDLAEMKECGACHSRDFLAKFNGVTICTPCRSFYTRIKNKKKPVSCTGGRGDCQITEKTRMFCAYCRCKRLISIGIPIDPSKMRRKKRHTRPKVLSDLAQRLNQTSARPPAATMATPQQSSPSAHTQTTINSPMELDNSDDSQQTIIRTPSTPTDQHDMDSQVCDNQMNVQTTQTPDAEAPVLPNVDFGGQEHPDKTPANDVEPLDLSKPSSNSTVPHVSTRIVTEIVELVDYHQPLDDVKPSTSGLANHINDVEMSTMNVDDSAPLNREISNPSTISRFFGDLGAFRAGSTTKKSADQERPLAEAKLDSARRKLLPNPNLDHRCNLTPSLNEESGTPHVRMITNLNFQLEQSSTHEQEKDNIQSVVAQEQTTVDVTLQSFETVIDCRPMIEARASAKQTLDSPSCLATIRHPDSVIKPDEDCDPDYVPQQEWEEIDCDL